MVAGNTEQELYSEVIALVIARPFLSLSLNLCQDTVHLQTCQTHETHKHTSPVPVLMSVTEAVSFNPLCCFDRPQYVGQKWRLSQQNLIHKLRWMKMCYHVVKWPHVSLLSLYSQFTSWPPSLGHAPPPPPAPPSPHSSSFIIHYPWSLLCVCVCVTCFLYCLVFMCMCWICITYCLLYVTMCMCYLNTDACCGGMGGPDVSHSGASVWGLTVGYTVKDSAGLCSCFACLTLLCCSPSAQ